MSTYKNLTQLLTKNERRQGLALLALMVVSMALEVLGVGLIVPVIALMTKPNFLDGFSKLQPLLSILGNPDQLHLVIGSMLLLIGFYFVKTLFMTYAVWKQNKFAFGILTDLSHRLFGYYLNQPWRFHLQRNSAQLIQNVTSEISIFVSSALQPGMMLLTEGLVLFGIAILLFQVQPIGTLIILAAALSVSWLFHGTTRGYILNWGKARQYHEGMRTQHLQQGLGGAKDVKLLGREQTFLDEYNTHNVLGAKVAQNQKTLMDIPRLWLELLAVIGLGVLMFVMIAKGKSLDTLAPTLGLFAAAAFRIMPSLNRILGAVQNLRYGLPVINSLRKEIQLVEKTTKPRQREALLSFKQDISLINISYRYVNSTKNALENINICIPRGTSVGFIGVSGAGKSTLVDIILGLLTSDEGYVRVDGFDIQSNLRGWQKQIGYVPQTIFLTDDTLRRNVAFGLSEALIDDVAVQRAIKAAQLEYFISGLPNGLDTLVGERGVRLSGGQRQRIGIARALYHDPDILVLDEATSSLDSLTEKGVMDAVNALQGNKTLLIVAHRLSTVEGCDKLYRMEQGCVVQEGSFDQVMNAYSSHGNKTRVVEPG